MPKSVKKSNTEIGYIKPREISQEMKESYIDYAMSVIISRALPDVRDGLKPVHRRILYTMLEDGLKSGAKFRKSATVVGSTLGRYHPHGDIAVYDALVRMAQDFSLRYPLVWGQGNFGSLDSDPPAAQRYTECKLSKLGEEMLRDIHKDTVDFTDNYDGTRKEPTVLPSPLPQLLLNGTLGIAVGMATNIPPHNLGEVVDAAVYLLGHPKATTEDLFEFIKGPDFPTGGLVYNRKELVAAYSQGKGPIVVRGKAEIVEKKAQQPQIVISEIPFQVRKLTLLEKFSKLVKEKKIDGIKDIRDESDKEGMRIVFDLSKNSFPQKILNRLYKFTELQKAFHLNMLALKDGLQPRVLSLVEILGYFLQYREQVVVRRAKYDLKKAKERAHILEGLAKALKNIDAVIKTIKASKTRLHARKNLIKKFKLSTRQAEAILDTKLSFLARLERDKIAKELKETLAQIRQLTSLLKTRSKIKGKVKKELLEIKERFADPRKTKLCVQKVGEISEEDLIPQEETIVTLTQGGYIKRIEPGALRTQKRGGKGILGMETVGEDIVEHFLCCQTHDCLLFFTDSGKVFQLRAHELPVLSRVAKGRGLANFLEISSQEKVLSIFALLGLSRSTSHRLAVRGLDGKIKKEGTASSAFEKEAKEDYLVMVTKNGIIKKTRLSAFKNVRRSGLIAITLKKDDLLKKVARASKGDEIILVTRKGQALRMGEAKLRPLGRTAAGVKGIRLKKGDEVIGMDVVSSKFKVQSSKLKEKSYLLVITENGYGKRTEMGRFRAQSRGGVGVRAAKVIKKTGDLVAAKIVLGKEKDLIVISQKGQVIRVRVDFIPILGRATQGVKIMRLDGDKVASVTCI